MAVDDAMLRRGERLALTIALVWSVGLFSQLAGQDWDLEQSAGPFVPLSFPILVAIVVSCQLWNRAAARAPGAMALVFIGLLALENTMGMLTIGPLLLPVTGSLVAACAIQQSRRRRTGPYADGLWRPSGPTDA